MPLFTLFSGLNRRAAGAALVLLASVGIGAFPAMAESAASVSGACEGPISKTGPVSNTWIKVVVEGLRNTNGQVSITLYPDDPSRFLAHHGSLYVTWNPTVAPSTATCLYLPHPGVWVIAAYHDENMNKTFDRTSLGLPAEAYGFSNNPPTLLGLPSFRSVRLNVTKSGLAAHIRLTYP